jgi:hypothetical protein
MYGILIEPALINSGGALIAVSTPSALPTGTAVPMAA